MTSSARPSDETQRIVAIDVVRGVALFGVLTVNLITGFRTSIFQQFLPPVVPPQGLDAAVERAVELALESKAFALFSLLFGVGLAIQFERLQESGRADYYLSRRLVALLAFGLVHLFFIWNGDILAEYAIAGFVVLPFLRLSAEQLVKGAALCLLVFFGFAFVPQPLTLPEPAALARHVAAATDVYANGSYAQIWHFSIEELWLMLPLHLNVFPRTVGLMLLGAGIWKSGLLGSTAAGFGGEAAEVRGELAGVGDEVAGVGGGAAGIGGEAAGVGGEAAGIGGGAAGVVGGAAGDSRGIALFGGIAIAVGFGLAALDRPAIFRGMVAPIVLALGYGALIYALASSYSPPVRYSRPIMYLPTRRGPARAPGVRLALRPLAALGRMAFTNYLLQSVVFSLIFFGFGAGQFGKMGAAAALLVGLAVYIGQAMLSMIWLRHFRFGPLEWLWRVLMYGTKLGARVSATRSG